MAEITRTSVSALGAVFSALEVVPLVFIGYEAWDNLRLSRQHGWVRKYRHPICFFVAVAFWNAVGAGLFGFMINPPVALYFMQGLNMTPVHGHAALVGVYGMLGLALMLFCARAADADRPWNEKPLAVSFWLMNAGLMAMVLFSLLPVGLLQTKASVEVGYWYARSAVHADAHDERPLLDAGARRHCVRARRPCVHVLRNDVVG